MLIGLYCCKTGFAAKASRVVVKVPHPSVCMACTLGGKETGRRCCFVRLVLCTPIITINNDTRRSCSFLSLLHHRQHHRRR